MSTVALERREFNPTLALLICSVAIGIAFGVVRSPYLVAGAVLGCAVLAVAITAPFALIAVMLMTGPIDLSFITGGFKSLFAEMGGLDMNGIRLIGATVGFLVYLMFEPRARSALSGSAGRLWLVFLLYAAVTLSLSLDRIEGMRLLLKIAYPLLTFLIVVGVATTRERLTLLFRFVLISAAILTLIINPILAAKGGYRIDPDGTRRFGGLGIGDSPFAFYCIAILFIAFSRFVVRRGLGYLALSAVMVTWIALTVTRIAALATVIGVGVIGVMAAYRAANKRIFFATAAVAALAAVFMVPNVLHRSLGFVPTPHEFFQIVRNPVVLYNSINWQGRQLLWAIAWLGFMASPLIGLGMGSSAALIRESFPNQNVKVVHNEYLRLACDTGLIGVALFASAVVVWLVMSLRAAADEDSFVQEIAFAAVAGIVAWGIIAITDNAFDYYAPFTQYVAFLVGATVAAREART